MSKPVRVNGSFRDPSGYVYELDGQILRTINSSYESHWECFRSSGFCSKLLKEKKIINFSETDPFNGAWKALVVDKVPFISFPYEWSFNQLKDAALLTLEIQKEALVHNMMVKDASAFNVQFLGSKAIFIDLLSFESREDGAPWQAYRQFCMHFLAPLAVYSTEARLGRLSTLWIDGLPLDIAWKSLPFRFFFSPGLQMHLHFHSIAENKYSDARKVKDKIKNVRIKASSLIDLTDSLIRTIRTISLKDKPGEWTDYYNDTNYSNDSERDKLNIVEAIIKDNRGDLAYDIGANTGKYSSLLSSYFNYVIAADIDSQAVDIHYRNLKKNNNKKVLPLVIDLANPSPAIGWSCEERPSFMERRQADCVCALAVTHHLFFTNRIPWAEQAQFFSSLLRKDGTLIMEFVAREDSQVERLLAARDDIFTDYNLETCIQEFSRFFSKKNIMPIAGSSRSMIVMTKK